VKRFIEFLTMTETLLIILIDIGITYAFYRFGQTRGYLEGANDMRDIMRKEKER
jgi:hypothetical protein